MSVCDSKSTTTTTLRQRCIGPDDVNLRRASKSSEVLRTVRDSAQSTNGSSVQGFKFLDGFALLDGCNIDLPAEATSAHVFAGSFINVIEKDLGFFSSLTFLDASDNVLKLEFFRELRALRDLRLPSNGIDTIGLLGTEQGAFGQLISLDLSYNSLSPSEIIPLAQLPALRQLDLSGNALVDLPDMTEFDALEILIVEDNKFEGGYVLEHLSGMANLREVALAYNYINHIPEQLERKGSFVSLEGLDLAYNYVKSQTALMTATRWPRLTRLLLYGNPLCGPSGKDTLGVCVDDLVIEATLARQGSLQTPLQVVTEPPLRVKRRKRGTLKNRQLFYSTVNVVDVDTDDTRSAKSFRQEGNQTLFEHAMELAKRAQEEATASKADDTFLTGVDAGSLRIADEIDEVVNHTQVMAKDVLGVVNPDTENALDNIERMIRHEASTTMIPRQLIQRSMANPAPLKPKSQVLSAAVKALRFALDHPLTDDAQVPGRGFQGSASFMKPTAAAQAKKNKRMSFVPMQSVAQAKAQEANYMSRVAGTVADDEKKRKRERAHTMSAMESILDELNQQTSVGALVLPGALAHTMMNPRSSRRAPRGSAGASLQSLIAMVEEVVDDLDR